MQNKDNSSALAMELRLLHRAIIMIYIFKNYTQSLRKMFCIDWIIKCIILMLHINNAVIILCMRRANESRCYNVTSSLIDRAHAQNDPW